MSDHKTDVLRCAVTRERDRAAPPAEYWEKVVADLEAAGVRFPDQPKERIVVSDAAIQAARDAYDAIHAIKNAMWSPIDEANRASHRAAFRVMLRENLMRNIWRCGAPVAGIYTALTGDPWPGEGA